MQEPEFEVAYTDDNEDNPIPDRCHVIEHFIMTMDVRPSHAEKMYERCLKMAEKYNG